MAGIDKRIEALEALIGQPEEEDPEGEARRALMRDIMNEYGRLRACRANRSYRGGTPPTPIQPTDPAGDALGYPYTKGELGAFAIRRVLEREDLEPESVDRLAAPWTERLRSFLGGHWDEVEAEGPPEPTRPWRGG